MKVITYIDTPVTEKPRKHVWVLGGFGCQMGWQDDLIDGVAIAVFGIVEKECVDEDMEVTLGHDLLEVIHHRDGIKEGLGDYQRKGHTLHNSLDKMV